MYYLIVLNNTAPPRFAHCPQSTLQYSKSHWLPKQSK